MATKLKALGMVFLLDPNRLGFAWLPDQKWLKHSLDSKYFLHF